MILHRPLARNMSLLPEREIQFCITGAIYVSLLPELAIDDSLRDLSCRSWKIPLAPCGLREEQFPIAGTPRHPWNNHPVAS